MSLELTPEQELLRDSVARLVAERTPTATVRKVVADGVGYDRALWLALAQDVGVPGLTIPTKFGGGGGSYTDLSVALGELGRGLVPTPVLASSVLAAETLLRLDDDRARRDILPAVAAGERIGTLAVTEPGQHGRWIPAQPAVVASGTGAEVFLDGVKTTVVNAQHADLLLVLAAHAEASAIFLVDRSAPGISVSALAPLDLTRSVADVEFRRTPARRLAGEAACALHGVADIANLAIASEQVGAALACLQMAAEYAKNRYVFGRVLGSYQAIKHRLADMLTDWELAYSSVREATRAADQEPRLLTAAAAAARSVASATSFTLARENVQIHGGIGYTWEHDAHLFYRRALSDQYLVGSPDEQIDRLADSLGIGVGSTLPVS